MGKLDLSIKGSTSRRHAGDGRAWMSGRSGAALPPPGATTGAMAPWDRLQRPQSRPERPRRPLDAKTSSTGPGQPRGTAARGEAHARGGMDPVLRRPSDMFLPWLIDSRVCVTDVGEAR